MKDTKRVNNNDIDKLDVKFSVSICVYKNDNPAHFKEALESVINQSRKPDEIVLVVDGPVPESINKVIQNYESNTFFKVIRLPENVGHGNARRIGLENCSYKLIALMDADDISVSSRFEEQVKCFEEDKDLSVVGGLIEEFTDTTDKVIGVRTVPTGDKDIKAFLRKRCPFNQVTVMFKKTDVALTGGYIDWYCEEDYYLWIRMYQKGMKFKNIAENLVSVRIGEEMYQRRGGWRYFISEAKLQGYMFNHGIISIFIYIHNVAIRFLLQILIPNRLRGFVFKKFVRKKA